MAAVGPGQRRAKRGTGHERSHAQALSAEHGEHGEDRPFDAERVSADVTLEDQRCVGPGVQTAAGCTANLQTNLDATLGSFMPTRADLLTALGPLAQIMPRVFAVLLATAASLLGAAEAGRCASARRWTRFVVVWWFAASALLLAWLSLSSLMAFGSPEAKDLSRFLEPLSLAGIGLMFWRHAGVFIAAIVGGPLIAMLRKRSRPSEDISAEAMLLERRRS